MLGSYLKEYRLDHNLTQRDMANKLGITNSYYNALENNKVKPGIATINKISKLLKVKPKFIREVL